MDEQEMMQDFYARITPGYIHARHPLQSGRHDLFESAMALVSERVGKFELVELVHALLFDVDAAEQRAAEADRKARLECIEIVDNYVRSCDAVEAIHAIRATIPE